MVFVVVVVLVVVAVGAVASDVDAIRVGGELGGRERATHLLVLVLVAPALRGHMSTLLQRALSFVAAFALVGGTIGGVHTLRAYLTVSIDVEVTVSLLWFPA